MKQVFVTTAFAIASAALVFGCASETTGPSSETGSVALNILIDGEDVTSVAFRVACDAGTLTGNLNVNDENDPPIAATVMDLPPGECTVTLTASNAQGEVLCTGSTDFTVIANQTVPANVVLQCGVTGEELLGNVNITGEFEFIVTNRCPRLHFLNAVPDEVPAEGSEVTVLVSDADGDTLTTALTATGGSFADPSAQPNTTYFCDGAAGAQTISVTVTDGDAACDKSKSFDVTCPGDNPCDGVVCDDTGNECTVEECNPANGLCEVVNLDGNECNAGGINDVAVNGGVETGNLFGWDVFCGDNPEEAPQVCVATDTTANTGTYSARLDNELAASAALIKQANKGIGVVQPFSQVTVRFAAKGNFGPGGVSFAEFFSEIEGGGTSSSEILGGGPILTQTTVEFQLFEFTVTTGDDVSGGVTVQFTATTGADAASTAEVFVDDVVILVEGGGAGFCQDGVCEPSDQCIGVDCSDNNECTIDECNPADGSCSNTADPGASCDSGAGTCDGAGLCQPIDLCEGNTCDDDDTECSDSSCDAGTGECVATPINEDGDCDGGAGTCNAGLCVPNATANAFIKTLDPNNGFQTSLIDTVDTTNLPDTWGGYTASITIPDDDAFINQVLQFGFQNNASNFQSSGVFYDNVVLNPGPEYTQDFDSFDITVTPIGDGWLFFNNVFDSAGNRKFGYNGLAPNATADTDPSDGETFISAIVDDQGGAGQGTQQLSVFSDYNCCGAGSTNEGHFGTDLVEVNVFQERRLTADDLGVTLEFIFEAKAGNIGQ